MNQKKLIVLFELFYLFFFFSDQITYYFKHRKVSEAKKFFTFFQNIRINKRH
jgi:hypothetical protein